VTLVTWFSNPPPGCAKGPVPETENLDAVYEELSARGAFDGPFGKEFWDSFAAFDDLHGNRWVPAASELGAGASGSG
jgi:hypothetical protein